MLERTILVLVIQSLLVFGLNAQTEFYIKRIGGNRIFLVEKGQNIAIKTKLDGEDVAPQLGNYVDSIRNDTLYITSFMYNEMLNTSEPFTKKIPISLVEEIGVVRGRHCLPTVAIFLGPAIILGGALGAMEEDGYNTQTLIIGASIGTAVSGLTYLWIRRCRPKMLRIGDKWGILGRHDQ